MRTFKINIEEKINLRFTSGNSVPVDSIRLTKEEWEEIKNYIDDEGDKLFNAGYSEGVENGMYMRGL